MKTIIDKNKTLGEQLREPERIIPLLNAFFTAYKELHTVTGLPVDIPLDGPLLTVHESAFRRFGLPRGPITYVTVNNFEWSEPRHDPYTGQEFYPPGLEYIRANQRRYLKMLFDHTGGRLSSNIKLNEAAWNENVESPDVYPVVKSLWFWSAEMESLHRRNMMECLRFMEVRGGQAFVDKDFERKLTSALTLYATPDQEEFYKSITPILAQLDAIEKRFGAKGLTLLGTNLQDDGYSFDILELKKVGRKKEPEVDANDDVKLEFTVR